jgi:branched-chain amino acid transport system permease protein
MSGEPEPDDRWTLTVMKGLELTRARLVLVVTALIITAAVPDIAGLHPDFQLEIIHRGLLWGFAAVGLNLMVRNLELYSFGHAAFFGGGAYTVAVLATKYNVKHIVLLLVGAVLVVLVLGVAIGFLIRRYSALTFGLLSLAFGQVLFAFVKNQAYFNYTDGLPIRPGPGRPLIFGIAFPPDQYSVLLYYLTVVVLVVGLLVMWRIVNSPFGVALSAIGQNRTRARFIGINVERYVWVAFVISAVYGGVAGGLYAMVTQHVLPGSTLSFFRSGEILFIVVLGGYQTLTGPILGGVTLIALQDIGPGLTEFFNALTGLVLLAVVFLFPKGIVGTPRAMLESDRSFSAQVRDAAAKVHPRQLRDAVADVNERWDD